MDKKIDGLILRPKIRWAEEGDKSAKYFYTLEKRNAVNKNISNLKVGDMLLTGSLKSLTKNMFIFPPCVGLSI